MTIKLDQRTKSELQRIRRANAAIRSCAQILNESGANEGSSAQGPGVFLALEPDHQMGLHMAIETCADSIAEVFDSYIEDELGVYWHDEWMPEKRIEAESLRAALNGEISFEEAARRAGVSKIGGAS